MLTNYLYDMGHREIAYVGTLCSTNSITDRYLGYQKSLMEHNLEVRKDWIIDDRNLETGKIDLNKNICLPKDMPTAFVCNCDLTAGYLIKKLQKAGYRVPEDISVVGFENYLYPGICDIEITTFEVDISEMARGTIHKVLEKIANETYTSGLFIVSGHMVHKDSVARR